MKHTRNLEPRRTDSATGRLFTPRILLLVLLLAAGISVYYLTPLHRWSDGRTLVGFILRVRGLWWTPLFLLGLYATFALLALPTGPLLMGGAVFGAGSGAVYNLLGLLMGATISFYAARFLGRDAVVRFGGRRMRNAETFLTRHGFWPLVQSRFTPLPFAVINFGSALAGVRSPLFLGATVVGLTPSTLIHTYFIAELFTADATRRIVLLVWYAAVFVVFNIILSLIWVRKWRG